MGTDRKIGECWGCMPQGRLGVKIVYVGAVYVWSMVQYLSTVVAGCVPSYRGSSYRSGSGKNES
jgi:hypothetical protein